MSYSARKYKCIMKILVKSKLIDAVKTAGRRFRNILANSGDIMESGDCRDLNSLCVMGNDGKVYKISELNKDPEKQTVKYAVKAQADHGEVVEGELIPTIEKQFGSCRVWLEDDGLHARMYFADDDELADHAWAISEDASYSTGIDWYPDGYYGTGLEIAEPIGILREISMVLTGNDPRALTIDSKSEAKGAEVLADEKAEQIKGEIKMPKGIKEKDALSADERDAFVNELSALVDKFTDKPADGGEEQPMAEDAKSEDVKSEDAAAKKEESKDALHMPIVVVRDRIATQESAIKTNDAYMKTDAAVAAWGMALVESEGNKEKFADTFRKIAKTRDGIDLGANVSVIPDAVVNAITVAMNDGGSIFGLVNKTGLNFETVAAIKSEGDAKGHVRAQTKTEATDSGVTRVLVPADLYKILKLDHAMVKINGGIGSSAIVKYVLNQLPKNVLAAIDQAILVGGVKNDDTGSTAFTAITSVLTDATAANDFASTYTAASTDNGRATISKAAAKILSGTNRVYATTQDNFTDLENSLAGTQLLFPNGINKDQPNINGIAKIVTPLWLTADMLGTGNTGIIFDVDNFHTVGDSTPEALSDYDIDTNRYVYEAVACIGGGLAAAKSAVLVKKSA